MSAIRTRIDRIRATPGLAKDTLVILLLLAIGFATFGYIVTQQRFVFPSWVPVVGEERISFEATFDEVPAISPGNGQELRVAGVTVGEITGADVTPDGQAVLTFSMDPDKATIYRDAELELRPKSPLNEMYVNVIDIGTPEAGEVTGDEEPLSNQNTRAPIPVDAVLEHLDENAREATGVLLEELDLALETAPETLPPGVVALDGTLQGLESLSTKLQTRRDLLAQMITGLANIGTGLGQDDARLEALVANATTTLQALAAQDEELRQLLDSLPGLTDDLGTATASLVELTGELNPTLDDLRAAADTLPGALDNLNGTIDQLDRTIDLARPFLADARPVVADLRAGSPDLRSATHALRDLTPMLDPATVGIVDYLPGIQAFAYNTTSVLQTNDATGPVLRGLLLVTNESLGVDPGAILGGN